MTDETETIVTTLLTNRGIPPEQKDLFLSPSYERDTHNPLLMPDMERAVVRIFEAIEAKERIAIYGDYDCDGIPGTVIFHDLFAKIGYTNVEYYIPDRHEEGYGLHKDAIDILHTHDVKLIVTVDLGITAVDEVAHAIMLDIDVIITDHHLPQAVLPHAYAIVNPKLPRIENGIEVYYPDTMLCGAGVAYKCVCAFLIKYGEYFNVPEGWERWLLDMVAIGTLSDMVPLQKENRVLARAGLQVLRKNGRMGLAELWRVAMVDARTLLEEDVTFTLAPRLNAASRMATPHKAFDVLRTRDIREAVTLAKELSVINDSRKKIVADIMRKVHKTLDARELGPVIVIGDPSWHVGVLGLIANKIMDTHKKPVFVWGGNDDSEEDTRESFKGSCRSTGDANVVSLMTGLPEGDLLAFGGHECAGGFTISRDAIHFFETRLCELFVLMKSTDTLAVPTNYDMTLPLESVTLSLYKTLTAFSPCGVANPPPTFLFESITPTKVGLFGKEKNHLELAFETPQGVIRAIAFFKTEKSFDKVVEVGTLLSLIGRIEYSTFMRKSELRLRILDIV